MWYVIGWDKNTEGASFAYFKAAGPGEVTLYGPVEKEGSSGVFQWSDKHQLVLVALEIHELISCYTHWSMFMPTEA